MNRRRFARLTAILPFALGGCMTTGGGVPDVRRMASMAKAAAYTGTRIWLEKHPADVQKFRDVVSALDILSQSGEFSPVSFHAVMSVLPIKELKGDEAAIVVGAAQVLWDEYAAGVVKLDNAIYIAPVMQAVREGIYIAVKAVEERTCDGWRIPISRSVLRPV